MPESLGDPANDSVAIKKLMEEVQELKQLVYELLTALKKVQDENDLMQKIIRHQNQRIYQLEGDNMEWASNGGTVL